MKIFYFFIFFSVWVMADQLYNAPKAKSLESSIARINSTEAPIPETELNALVGQFYASAKRFIPNSEIPHVPVFFGTPKDVLSPTAEGACFQMGSRLGHVEIDRTSWGLYDHWQREELVYHELGHCVLKREHDGREITVMGEKIHRSIMFPQMMDENTFVVHRDYYLRELFSQTKESPRLASPAVVYYYEEVEDE